MLTNDTNAEEAGEALARLLNAPELRLSERNKRFLRYVVEETLAGRGDRIKSYSIALDVFGRPADFDGVKDSIVRTEATRLRSALAAFYRGAGANEPLRIWIPPGAYVPHFERVKPPMAGDEVRAAREPSNASPAQGQAQTKPSLHSGPAPRLMSLARAATAALGALAQVLELAARTGRARRAAPRGSAF